ncbi:kinase [Thraustotheca clavata]|uniref:Kinase n=1 Tax=Thraustotheca clavata TaxID=74557 RepID=A0A1W0A0Q6_9STRA|nr:kinase [Thraustotheca clavata]
MVVGVSVGAVVAILLAVFSFCWFRRRTKNEDDERIQSLISSTTPGRPHAAAPQFYQSHSTGVTTGSSGVNPNSDSEVVLDVSPLRQHKLELTELILASQTPLATGAKGKVALGYYAGEKVAIKGVLKRTPKNVAEFIDEIKILAQIDCPYIVQFIGASWRRPIDLECVVEYMDLGDLRGYLSKNTPESFTWAEKYKSIVSIVRGLIYLHTLDPPIIHRDLKSRNVLLDSKKGTKLTDFGESREINASTLTAGVGTYQWMAPEILSGTKYDATVDIYSFGPCTLS